MPIIAIGGALLASAIAAPAVGGLIAGGALTLTGALEITAAVGATLGAVGAVTRDKSLQTAGLVLGGIGGIGSLASAAGLIDGGTELFGAASSAAGTGAGEVAGNVADATASGLPAGAMSPEGFAGGLSDAESAAAGLPAGAMSPMGFPGTNVVDSLSGAGGAANAIPPDLAAATQTPAQAANASASLTGQDAAVANYGSPVMGQAQANLATPPSPAAVPAAAQEAGGYVPTAVGISPNQVTGEFATDSGGYLSGIADFAKNNPLATYGLIQAGGSLVGGMFNPVTPAQVSLYDAQAANNRAAASMTSQQVANIKSGMPSATRIPQQVRQSVTGAPVGSGLINQNPGTVTGMPA